MPPAPKKIQRSIKEMLQAKTAKDDIIIPEIFREYVDIRAHPASNGEAYSYTEPTYHCSSFACLWFREHSNFSDVLFDYWTSSESRQSRPKEDYAPSLMRMLTSIPRKRQEFPLSTFRFNSEHDEAIVKMLLMNPMIKEEDDLQQLMEFHNNNKLKLSTVSLSLDNNVQIDALAYVREKQRSQKTKSRPVYSKRDLSRYIRRQFYKRSGLTKDIYVVDLTVEELEEISSFNRVVLRLMSERGYHEKHYKTFSAIFLDVCKDDPELLLEQKDFTVEDPKVNLICNVMTVEQQTEAATNMESLYKVTNAKRECRRLRDGTTREEFYEMYRTRNDHEKKLVPFHRLCYKKKKSEGVAAAVTTTTTIKITEVQFQRRVRYEPNNHSEAAPTIEPTGSSSEASNDTVRPTEPSTSSNAAAMNAVTPVTPVVQVVPAEVVQETISKFVQETPANVVQETPRVPPQQKPSSELAGISTETSQNHIKVELTLPSASSSIPQMIPLQSLPAPQLQLPQRFLELSALSEEAFELATIMCQNRRFVCSLKHTLGARYKLNFEDVWKENKQTILVAYIKDLWDNDWVMLKQLIEKCPTEVEADELKSIILRRESRRSESTDVSFTTAASDQGDTEEQSLDNDIELEAGEVPKPGLIPVIKQEPQTNFTASYTDVECFGPEVGSEVITEDSLMRELQDEAVNVNPFLVEINGGTSVAITTTHERQDSNPNNSEETLKIFEAFVPLSVHQKIADSTKRAFSDLRDSNKPSTSGTKRKSPNLPGNHNSAKKSRPTSLCYLDDEESDEIDAQN